MSNVVSIAGGVMPEQRSEAAAWLRSYADMIESGDCSNIVFMAEIDGEYQYRAFAAPMTAVGLTALAHSSAMARMRE